MQDKMAINLDEEEREILQKLNQDLNGASSFEEANIICQKRIAQALTIIAYKIGRKIK